MFFGLAGLACIALAIVQKIFFTLLERYYRREVPPELRTDAYIQQVYDGA